MCSENGIPCVILPLFHWCIACFYGTLPSPNEICSFRLSVVCTERHHITPPHSWCSCVTLADGNYSTSSKELPVLEMLFFSILCSLVCFMDLIVIYLFILDLPRWSALFELHTHFLTVPPVIDFSSLLNTRKTVMFSGYDFLTPKPCTHPTSILDAEALKPTQAADKTSVHARD